MEYFDAIWRCIILGTVQGLTEFLPVSSSGHLSLLQRLLGSPFEGGSMTFVNVMLHLGTLLPVLCIFRKDILALFKRPFKTLLMLAAATVPAAAVGLLLHDRMDALFAGADGIVCLALCFAVTATLLLVCEYAARRRKRFLPLGWGQAAAMGAMQAVALLPGISRSGATVFAGTVSGAKAADVARFSFLMSIPVIAGSAAVELMGVLLPSAGGVRLGGPAAVGLAFGVLSAAAAGFFAVRVMMRVIGKGNYKWFSLYLALLSLLLLWLNILQVI